MALAVPASVSAARLPSGSRAVAILLLGALAVAGCDGTTTVPADPRLADIVVTSEPGGSGTAVGYVTFDVAVRLVRQGGSATSVGEASGEGLALLDGSDTVRILTAEVPDAPYSSVRLVFTSVRAQVDGGLTVGGSAITGEVTVGSAAADSIVVERPFTPPAGSAPLRILIDVRGREWLPETDPATRTVPAARFAAAVRVGRW